MQQSDRIIGSVVGAERIGADELSQAIGAMGLCHPSGPHLVQDDAYAGSGDLPGSFGAGQARADDMHGLR